MRPACMLAGSRGIVSLLLGVQSKTGFTCAIEMAAKAQTKSAAKMEVFLMVKVLAGEKGAARDFGRKGLRKYRGLVAQRAKIWAFLEFRPTSGDVGWRRDALP